MKERKVREPKVVQKGEQLELPLAVQIWLDKGPSRNEKTHFAFLFERMKKSMFCNLNRDTHVF